jgi:hypothetical protein
MSHYLHAKILKRFKFHVEIGSFSTDGACVCVNEWDDDRYPTENIFRTNRADSLEILISIRSQQIYSIQINAYIWF